MLKKRYYRTPKIKRLKPALGAVVLLICVLVGVFAVYRFMHPFQSLNPLHHEITVGEKVIDDWTYNGKNDAGDLVFYKSEEHHTLPPDAHELALDGKYVVIVEATDNSLTYADPIETFPFQWIVVLIGVVGFIFYRVVRKRGRKMKLPAYHRANFKRSLPIKRFRIFGPRGFKHSSLRLIRKYFR